MKPIVTARIQIPHAQYEKLVLALNHLRISHYTRRLIASDMSPDEATRLALADFRDGKVLADYIAPLRQAHPPSAITPGAPGGQLLSDLWQDLRYAARTL